MTVAADADAAAANADARPCLTVVRPGLFATIQDLGRFGYQELGMPVAGALDPLALRLANALAGNPPGTAGLEIALLGPVLRVDAGSVRVAAAGPLAMTLERPGQAPEVLAPHRSHTLRRGDLLRLGAVEGAAVACLAVAGGFALEPVMGSLSTYVRAGVGPLGGRPLADGDRLPLGRGEAPAGPDVELPQPPDYGTGPLRVVLGPQEDRFTEAAVATFLSAPYRVGKEADRMGLRLEGPALEHRGTADIPSDGLVTGSVQVPGSGQPILLLNDHQTAGGYAKIATVISADLPRAGRLRPGDALSFRAVAVEEAEAIRRRQEQAIAAWIQAIRPARPAGGIDLEALYAENLISGTVDIVNGGSDLPLA
ncbi:biotin-dependent carboxyltransferase family protein [Azospirillum picis]|uniref:5-oxoprolinase subunit C family protein n=1 Tax=Azospirillum picis TaxID=488438 RepID=UPI003621D8D1